MTDLIHAPAPPSAEPLQTCVRCGGALASDQRWCLNCGTRREGIPSPFARSAAPASRLAPPPPPLPAAAPPVVAGPPRWLLGVLAIGVAAVLFAVGLVVGLSGGDRRTIINVPPGKAPVVNVTAGGGVVPVASADPSASFVSDWPDGKDGWTVQLESLADPAGVDAAKAEAEGKGATDVGALNSDDYASLPPSQYIVYSGVFDAKGAAKKALGKLKQDFPDAKVIRVSATGDTGGGGKETTGSADDIQQNLPPEQAAEQSKKLPDEVVTEGTPPPTDDKPAGGGDGGGTTIG